ncbi:MAG: hypothetical protein U9R60_17755 [Bacteroidota bacterium]|nr:hypothetical protein [Bacteroidota bacterium]
MKRTIFTLLIAIVALSVSAQDLTSKKGVPILPEAGDYAIGICADPILSYVGNMFNGTTNNWTPFWDYKPNLVPYTLYGKYFKDAQTAYRGYVRIGFASMSDKEPVPSTADPAVFVEDKMTESYSAIGLGFGLEKRKGKGRVQGFYGGEVGLAFQSETTKYTYGNEAAPDALFYDFESGYVMTMGEMGYRVTEVKDGTSFGIGVRGFAGVEYFFAPKISIGGEFGWSLGFGSDGKSTGTTEDVTGETQESEGASDSMFRIDTDNWGGTIMLTFYF